MTGNMPTAIKTEGDAFASSEHAAGFERTVDSWHKADSGRTTGKHFVYQRVHTLGSKVLHLDGHLRIAARAFEHIYGSRPDLDERGIAAGIAGYMRMLRSPERVGNTVMLYFVPTEDGGFEILREYERPLLETGYALSPLRPRAVTFEYSIPFGAFPTNFALDARALFDTLALRRHSATRSVRREGDSLLACGDAPIFGIRGRVLVTPPLTEGAMDSVERGLVLTAAAKSRLSVREEPILHPELKSFDELFFADASGITSLSECDGAKFMSLAAPRLAAAMK